MGIFDKIKEAQKGAGSGLYLEPGSYEDLEILGVKASGKRNSSDNFFVVELLVHKSSGEKAQKPGLKPSWMVKMSLDSALGDVKDFLAKAMQIDPSAVDPAGGEIIVGPTQPLRGYHMSAVAYHIPIKSKPGQSFTRVDWAFLSKPTGVQAPAPAAAAAAPAVDPVKAALDAAKAKQIISDLVALGIPDTQAQQIVAAKFAAAGA